MAFYGSGVFKQSGGYGEAAANVKGLNGVQREQREKRNMIDIIIGTKIPLHGTAKISHATLQTTHIHLGLMLRENT